MPALQSRVEELMLAPVAAATFVLAARCGLDAERLADPATATAVATTAVRELNPWTGDAAARRARALDAVRPLEALVGAVAADRRNAWWSAPLDRGAQLLLTDHGDERDPLRLPVPTGPVDHWESYAQKPLHSVLTSTGLRVPAGEPIRSGAHAQLACGGSDWSAVYPVRQARLTVAATARVHQLDSAADWHRFALRYGDPAAHHGPDGALLDAAGIDNGLAPTWSAAAADVDGVHLSFAGLLTALYVPCTTGGTTTTLWAWEWECTHWLRPVFTAVTVLPDLPRPPADPGYPAFHAAW